MGQRFQTEPWVPTYSHLTKVERVTYIVITHLSFYAFIYFYGSLVTSPRYDTTTSYIVVYCETVRVSIFRLAVNHTQDRAVTMTLSVDMLDMKYTIYIPFTQDICPYHISSCNVIISLNLE